VHRSGYSSLSGGLKQGSVPLYGDLAMVVGLRLSLDIGARDQELSARQRTSKAQWIPKVSKEELASCVVEPIVFAALADNGSHWEAQCSKSANYVSAHMSCCSSDDDHRISLLPLVEVKGTSPGY